MNPNNPSKAPPDPNIPNEGLLRKIAELARPTPEFRTDLRKVVKQLDFMSKEGLQEVARSCGINLKDHGPDPGYAKAIISWLEEFRRYDEQYMETSFHAGAKRKPSKTLESQTSKPCSSKLGEMDSERRMPEDNSAKSEMDTMEVDSSRNAKPNDQHVMEKLAQSPQNPQSFDMILLKLSQANERTCSTLTECLGLLQLAHQGNSPDKFRCGEALLKIKDRLTELEGIQIGLSLVNNCQATQQASGVEQNGIRNSFASSIPSQQPRPSYATVASLNTKSSSAKRNSQRDLRRQSISAHRLSIRCDSRSIKFKAVKATRAVQSGILAKSILKTLGMDSSRTKSVIEDIRLDRFGTYYVQIHQSEYEIVSAKITDVLDSESTMKLDGLGHWTVLPPSISRCAGKRPVIVDTVPLNWSVSQCVDELWLSNAESWGLNASNLKEKELNLSEGIRLNRRRKPNEPQQTPGQDWIATKSMKLYVSHNVFAFLKKSGFVVRFDYCFLNVREFINRKRRCERCLEFGSHCASTCRNCPKCAHCGGRHMTTECEQHAQNMNKEIARKSGDLTLLESDDVDMNSESNFQTSEPPPFFNMQSINTRRGAEYMEDFEDNKSNQ